MKKRSGSDHDMKTNAGIKKIHKDPLGSATVRLRDAQKSQSWIFNGITGRFSRKKNISRNVL